MCADELRRKTNGLRGLRRRNDVSDDAVAGGRMPLLLLLLLPVIFYETITKIRTINLSPADDICFASVLNE